MAILGFPLAMLHQAATPHEYHCQACGRDFARRTRWEKIAFVALVGLIAILVLVLLAAIILGLR